MQYLYYSIILCKLHIVLRVSFGEKKKKQHSLTSLKVWRLYPRYTQVGQCAVTFFSCTHFEDHSSIFVWNKFRHRTSLRIFRINLKYLNADLCLYHNFHYSTEDMLTYKSLNKFIMPLNFCIFGVSVQEVALVRIPSMRMWG